LVCQHQRPKKFFDAYETRKASSPEKTPHCRTLAIECGATQEFEDFYSFYSRYTHPTAYSLFGDHTSSVRDIFLDRAVIYAGYCAEEMSKILEVAIELNQKSPGLNSGEWFQTAAFLLSPCAIILPTESSTRPGCKAFRQASESLTDFDRFAPSCLGLRNLQRLAARDQKLLQARETRKTKRDPNAYSLNFSPVPRGRSLSPSTNAGPAHLPPSLVVAGKMQFAFAAFGAPQLQLLLSIHKRSCLQWNTNRATLYRWPPLLSSAHSIESRVARVPGFFSCGYRGPRRTSPHYDFLRSCLCRCGALRYSRTKANWSDQIIRNSLNINYARMAELADAPDLGSGGAILVGSSPSPGISS
jgi:hypothetical protein